MDEKENVNVSAHEAFWLWIMRKNQAEKTDRIERKWQIGRLKICYGRRRKKEFWGRFGGGWNWELGFTAGGSTIIFNLLVATLRCSLEPKEKKEA